MPDSLASRLPNAALAFRGYNQTNLGRTPDLMAVPAYRPFFEHRLDEAGRLLAESTGREADLIERVEQRREAGVEAYAEAIALVFAAELAQLDALREIHRIDAADAKVAFGYSLGELTAVAVNGLYPLADVMRLPLTLAADCAALADDSTMAIVFSRKAPISEARVHRLCEEVTADGPTAIAVSAVLSPNTLLVIGEGDSVSRLKRYLKEDGGPPVMVRTNDGVWPPLHTPLVSQRHVPDRAALMIRRVPRLAEQPRPPILSMVTGADAYRDGAGREVLRRWVDSPQRLWDVIEGVLSSDVRTVLHIGPDPNVIPATFHRLADNVVQQTLSWTLTGVGLRTVQRMAGSTWLAPLLPRSGCLLRAPMIEHVVLEEWLLENAPG